jgi:ABC-2 type transport system ATP-binding protein
MAKAHGARVATTVGTDEKAELCRQLGAYLVVNYRKLDFAAEVRDRLGGADVILDIMGASYLERNLSALSTNGRLAIIDVTEANREAARKRVGAYSLGMRQRLGLAQALLGDPQVLLLDEPANGLDPEGIHWVRGLLRALADEGRAVLVSSHLLGEVARLADDVIVIRKGQLVTQASVAELTGAASGAAVVVSSTDDPTLLAALQAAGAETAIGPDGMTVTGLDAETIGKVALEARVALRELRPVLAQLEDVFMELTAGGEIA